MDQLGQFVESHLLGSLSKHKKQTFNAVGFPGAIGAYNGAKILVERSNDLFAVVRLEVFEFNLTDHQSLVLVGALLHALLVLPGPILRLLYFDGVRIILGEIAAIFLVIRSVFLHLYNLNLN